MHRESRQEPDDATVPDLVVRQVDLLQIPPGLRNGSGNPPKEPVLLLVLPIFT